MFKSSDYINFEIIISKLLELEQINRNIDINKLKKFSGIDNERIKEFIATNNIEGDIISFTKAKLFLNKGLNKEALEKRWMGIKYASQVIWSDKFAFNIENIHEVHRALMRSVETTGGTWKTKINQVGSLITSHPSDVQSLMHDLFSKYHLHKINAGGSVFNIIPFISEFLAIHPYEDGNGRISRLMTNRELYDAGFLFTKYISISKFLWKQKDEYIVALESRNKKWASDSLTAQDLIPLFKVILEALIKAAKQAQMICGLKKISQQQFHKQLTTILYKPLSIKEIIDQLKIANSKSSINKWLKVLVDNNKIKMTGSLKASKYEIFK